MSDIADVFDAVAEERAYQDARYGAPAERALSIGDYLVIARGELLEAEQSFQRGVPRECLLELSQVAAVIVACLERHGVVRRG
jgi:hypothetical protein